MKSGVVQTMDGGDGVQIRWLVVIGDGRTSMVKLQFFSRTEGDDNWSSIGRGTPVADALGLEWRQALFVQRPNGVVRGVHKSRLPRYVNTAARALSAELLELLTAHRAAVS